ncbi:MAG: threonylcarbamoyl-AMP synthase [Planctomycetota bacterium]|nr:MAG: threonylcarbamoyl-AMP synthase [Planctomycetota bacterium]
MDTKVLKIDSEKDYWNVIREAAYCLQNGGLVVFPTETVYGLGANAIDPATLNRLHGVKNRPKDKPFTVHIGARSAVDRFVPDLKGLGRRFTQKAWPGPLTLIFNVENIEEAPVIRDTSPQHGPAMYHQGTIGIRCPDDQIASNLLNETTIPVVAASANPAGSNAPVNADEALATLEGKVELVIDAGTTRYAKASTIVQVNRNGYEILREGVLDERTIRRLATVNILLVCTGNTCRSPMAAGLFRRMLAERIGCQDHELDEHGFYVESAGTGAFANAKASIPAITAMKTRGIDISNHKSQPLRLEQIDRADYIFTMTAHHLDTVTAISAVIGKQARRIDDSDIDDPIGGSDEVYENCAKRLEKALRCRLEELSF